jgi:16S rRNA processing protein RimM
MRHALVVGRIVRPHGLRGELSVEVRTDEPGLRYAAGAVLDTDPPSAGPLTVVTSRWHSGRLLVSFAEVADRTEAESLRGVWLTVDAATVPLPDGPDEFHDQQLTGLTVLTVSGELVGTVSEVLHYGQTLLSVTPAAGTPRRAEVLVPFVAAIAVEVDVTAGKLIIDPPPGLLDLAPDGAGPDPTGAAGDSGGAGASAGPDDAGAAPGDGADSHGGDGSGAGGAGTGTGTGDRPRPGGRRAD